jgi:hypothetical protein
MVRIGICSHWVHEPEYYFEILQQSRGKVKTMRYLLILLLFASCATVRKNQTVTNTDSVHVTVTDTSRRTIELTDYANKTVEVYDTVRISKDSVITMLRYRTIWETKKQYKDETKNAIVKDSVRVVTKEVVKTKTVDSTNKLLLLFAFFGILLIIAAILYKIK